MGSIPPANVVQLSIALWPSPAWACRMGVVARENRGHSGGVLNLEVICIDGGWGPRFSKKKKVSG